MYQRYVFCEEFDWLDGILLQEVRTVDRCAFRGAFGSFL